MSQIFDYTVSECLVCLVIQNSRPFLRGLENHAVVVYISVRLSTMICIVWQYDCMGVAFLVILK